MPAKTQEEIREKASAIWDALDDNQRTGVQFGLLPAEVMRAAERDGYTVRELSLALMDCTRARGGMRV